MELELLVADGTNGVGIPMTFNDFEELPEGFDPFVIPYEGVLCFDGLLQRIEEYAVSGGAGVRLLAAEVLRRLEDHPELRGPIYDLELIRQHADLFDLLLLFLVSPLDNSTGLYKFGRPFQLQPLFLSPALRSMMQRTDACYSFGAGMEDVYRTHLTNVGCEILRQCYGVEVTINLQALLTVPDQVTGLKRFYKPIITNDFNKVVVKGKLPPLSEQQIQRLLHNLHDADLWLELLPPSVFSFHGFHLAHLLEVTTEESLSQLKHRLISRDAVLDVERVRGLADLLRLHFQLPELQLGLTAVDYPTERAIDHEYRIRYNLLADQIGRLTDPEYGESIYHSVFRSGEMTVIEDLQELSEPGILEEKLLELGYRSLLLAPLLSQDKHVIGLVELASPEPYALNAFLEDRFQEIRGMFRTAVERSREYIDNRIEAIMREQYTSLHPAVEWRFSEAAFNILQRQEEGLPQVAEEIRFKRVYPLYGQADIVGSSNLRNYAIYQDLFDNLRSGRYLLERSLELVKFPIVDQAIRALDVHLGTELEDFDNGHEIRIGDFIHKQLTPLIGQLGEQLPELSPLAREYQLKLNPELGLFYRVRRDYEQSVNTLNRSISDFLTERDQESQRILPHYFEKYKTDGVEYEIYAGQSLLKRHKFSRIHLRNLRLSQLVDMCELTRRVEALSATLPMPLRTAQLVFAYTAPLNIRFRLDEKRFDVDGDYNVRYEILKKRIDKATIDGGHQRLTQAGMVSVVYLQDKDADEYNEYLGYLQQAGYVDGEIEELVIDPLQSVNGLRALRFSVKAERQGEPPSGEASDQATQL